MGGKADMVTLRNGVLAVNSKLKAKWTIHKHCNH